MIALVLIRRAWAIGLLQSILLAGLVGSAAAQSQKIPGMSLGSFKVSNNGAANYTIPITAPPSFGPIPKIGIAYDSQTTNGTLGVGMSLSGLSAIHRCPQSRAQDNLIGGVNYDANDRWCLDGQRLMVISGTYGADGAEYRTELDTFVRVFSYGQVSAPGTGPQYFIVKNKAGETMEFGNTLDSRIEAIGQTSIRVWALNKITDTSGNFLTITYEEVNSNVDKDYRPIRIDYAGNAGQGVTPQRSVQFIYEDRTDNPPLYLGGSAVKNSKRLSKIQTYAPPPGGGAAVLAREYRLAYEYGTATQRSRLKTVTECATTCLPPHTFNWQDAQTGFVSPIPVWTSALWGNDAKLNFVGDFDGDGKSDIVSWLNSTQVKVHLSTGSGFDIQTWSASLNSGGYNYVGDFNGDGKADILSRNGTSCYLYLSTGSGFNKISVACSLSLQSPLDNMLGDFNGDGRADIASFNGHVSDVTVNLSTGAGFDIQTWTGIHITSHAAFPSVFHYVGDFNGDGLSDIVNYPTTSTPYINLSTGSGFINTVPPQFSFYTNAIANIGDFNGDGKSDIAVKNGASTDVYLSTTGFNFVKQTWAGNLNGNGYNYLGDFNADGKTDIVARGANNASCSVILSTGLQFSSQTLPCSQSATAFNYVGDFDGDGKADIIQRVNGTSANVNLSSGPFPDLITSITTSLGGKIDISYKPITDSSVYTKDSDAVYPVMDLQVPIYVVDNYISRTQGDANGQNFQYTYDYGGAKFHLLGRGGLGFRWIRVVDETAHGQTTSYFNQTFPMTGMLNFSETVDTQNPTSPFAQISNTYTAIDTEPGLTLPSGEPRVRFPALARTDKSQCDGQPACLQTADEFTYDITGNLTLTHHLGNILINPGDERDEVTDWIVDAANWIHRPKRSALLDSAGATVREKWIYYDDQAFGVLGTRALVTKEESRLTGGQGDAGNPSVSYHYDGFANRDITTNPNSCSTTAAFDSTHTFPATVTNCLSHAANFTWDPRFGVKLSETDPNNQTTSFTYDTFGRPVTVVGPLDSVSFPSASYFYLNWGDPQNQRIQTLTRKDHGGTATISRLDYFDGLGRFDLVKSDGPGGTTIVEDTTYDSRGLVTAKSAPHFTIETALFTQSVYDVLGRPTTVTFPDGRSAQTQYLPGKVTLTDERGKQKIKISDAYGRVTEIDEKNGTETYITQYEYDPTGSLVRTTNHLGHHTRVAYDPLGRKIAMCDPNMGAGPNTTTCDATTTGAWKYSYDKAGNLLTQTDAKNQTLTFDYDQLSRVQHKTTSAGTITYTYDDTLVPFSKGRLTRVDELNSMATTFLYDAMGRVTQTQRTIDGTTYTMSQTYNALSKVTSESFPDLDGATYSYDSAGFLSAIPGYVNSITYNARGQKATIGYANNVTTTFNYFDQSTDLLKNFALKSRVTSGPGGNLQNLSYDYDDGGNVESITDSLFTASRTFGYDDLSRLTSASGTFGGTNQSQTTCGYSFDAIGNILNKCGVSYSYNDLSHPSFVTSTSDGKTYAADPNGNTLTGAGRTFTWGADNRVDSVTNASGTTSMDYDYTGSRVKKYGPLGLTIYPFPGYEVAPDGTKTKFFRAGTEMLASKQSPIANPEKKGFYHNDHLGGVNVISDITGARVQLTEYDPWGKVSRSEGNVDPENRFTGQKLDPESGLYYYGARYYDPDLGRFISPDSIVPAVGDPQSHNRYSYTRNNPVKYVDPTGHSFLSFLGGFFGAIFKVFNIVTKYIMPAFRLAGGVLELMGGNILSGLQSIASSMSSYIKNSQFQFASQVFGFFGGGAAGSAGAGVGTPPGDYEPQGVQYAAAESSVVTDIGTGGLERPFGPNPTLNQQGLELIAGFEKFSSQVYTDPAGFPTVGFGHRIFPGESFPNPLTREEGWELLQNDVATRVQPYLGRVEVALTQNQVNAAGSFVFNIGGGRFLNSTLFQQLNAGNFEAAALQFSRWVYAGGQIQPGLVTRRAVETDLFLGR